METYVQYIHIAFMLYSIKRNHIAYKKKKHITRDIVDSKTREISLDNQKAVQVRQERGKKLIKK